MATELLFRVIGVTSVGNLWYLGRLTDDLVLKVIYLFDVDVRLEFFAAEFNHHG